MTPRLSILICSLESRAEMYGKLHDFLTAQIGEQRRREVEICNVTDTGVLTTGAKRNLLLDMAKGEYLCFVDDDDWVSDSFVDLILKALESNPDCVSLMGELTTDGQNPEIFEHSLKYKAWKTNEGAQYPTVKYERYPNHLNVIRLTIAKQFRFPDKTFGEDHNWSKQIHESGLLKTESRIEEVIYYYLYKSKK